MSDQHPATTGHARSAPGACSVLWDHDGTSAYGTAARAGFFVVIEQPGPWGRRAAVESHLPPELGQELDEHCSNRGGRFMLIRRPGQHVDHSDGHRVLLAHAGHTAQEAWLVEARVASPSALLGLDWTALAAGRRDLVVASLPGAAPSPPTLLVCTNGRRDVCCAVRGRPLAAAAAQLEPDRVWEVSHTGGHRFAPTAVLLPWGQVLARLTVESTAAVLRTSLTGHLPSELLGPGHDRGRSALAPPLQAAESFVRHLTAETSLSALTTDQPPDTAPRGPEGPGGGPALVRVCHQDGRAWQVRVVRQDTGLARPESCGKAPVEVQAFDVSLIA